MNYEIINIQQKQEANEAIRRFAALSPDKQQAALLILYGIQIGEEAAAHTAGQDGKSA